MGWTGTHKPKEVSVKEFFKEEFGGENGQVIDVAVNLKEAYIAYENLTTGEVIGIVCLIRYYPKDYFNLMYKDMTENMGPFYYGCPEKILNLLTEPKSEEAKEWRRKCREKLENKKRNKKVKEGSVIKLDEPLEFSNGEKVDTFILSKVNKKTRFHGARKDAYGNWEKNPYSLYRITKWKERDFEVLA